MKDQESRAKSGCRRVYEKTLSKVLVIDDESYVPLYRSDIPGKRYFHAESRSKVDYKEKIIPKAKFFKKFLVWQAMDEFGSVSESFVSEGSMTSKVYLEECIKKRLIPCIDKHHLRQEVFFWPDMDTCHYAHSVTTYLSLKKIDFIQKGKNAPNVPQARGIQDFGVYANKSIVGDKKSRKMCEDIVRFGNGSAMKSQKSLSQPLWTPHLGIYAPSVVEGSKELILFKSIVQTFLNYVQLIFSKLING